MLLSTKISLFLSRKVCSLLQKQVTMVIQTFANLLGNNGRSGMLDKVNLIKRIDVVSSSCVLL